MGLKKFLEGYIKNSQIKANFGHKIEYLEDTVTENRRKNRERAKRYREKRKADKSASLVAKEKE